MGKRGQRGSVPRKAKGPDLAKLHEGYLNTHQAAAYLGVVPMTVYRLVKQRRIAHYKIGAALRFRKEELDEFMAAQRVAPRRGREGKG